MRLTDAGKEKEGNVITMPNTAARLSDQQVAAYDRDGFVAVDRLLAPPEIADLQQVTDEFVEQSRAVTAHTEVFDLEPGHTPESPRLRRLKAPHRQHLVYDRLLRDARILDLVEQLIGAGIRFQGTKLNLKSPSSAARWAGTRTGPSTRTPTTMSWLSASPSMTCWLENGCLMVVPGSHRGPTLSHHQNGVFVGSVEDGSAGADAVPLELHAGGISIHHSRLVHGSAPNTSSRPRRLLLFEYCAADAWPLLGREDWDEYRSRLLRGEEAAQPRIKEVPVRIPLPEPARTGSIYELQSQRADARAT